MPALSRIVSVPLRIGELAFAAVVIGVVASYIKDLNGGSVESRFIYILVIAGISILLSLLWLLPFSGGFHHWPVDLILAFTWFAAFGLLIDWADRHNCASNVFKWGGITEGSKCDVWRLSEAFAFLSACFWLASGLLGLWFISRAKKERAAASARASATAGPNNGGRWYRSKLFEAVVSSTFIPCLAKIDGIKTASALAEPTSY